MTHPATSSTIIISGLSVTIIKKRIKHSYLKIHTTSCHLRLSVPLKTSLHEITELVSKHWTWIQNKIKNIKTIQKPIEKKYITGEKHAYQGMLYPLCLMIHPWQQSVTLSFDTIVLSIKENNELKERQALLISWYREQLYQIIPNLIQKYEPLLQVKVHEFRVKVMKTRWGSCNITDKRIWLNFHLIKLDLKCLEYVVVHEMAHLLERYHNKRFYKLIEKVMPDWKTYKDQLNQIHLIHLL
ncbi:MAG: M48 family metallopeptidase [Endozoicomonadaceae bacterium]|nr:M48 family metallopeptidase [Endozoicomonadaceae bacterium]